MFTISTLAGSWSAGGSAWPRISIVAMIRLRADVQQRISMHRDVMVDVVRDAVVWIPSDKPAAVLAASSNVR
jgi:hypothetical protein